MKYSENISAIVLFMSFCSFAGIDLKVGGGLNLSNEIYSGDYELPKYIDQKMHIGFNAGANVAIYFSKQLGMITGLCYETRGTKMDLDSAVLKAGNYGDDQVPMEFSMSYLQIPVFFSFRPIPALAISLGPELGIFLGGKEKIGNATGKMKKDDIKPVDFGASLTVDYTIANMIAVGAGYYQGFINNDNRSTADSAKGGIRPNNIKLFVAYVFHLKA